MNTVEGGSIVCVRSGSDKPCLYNTTLYDSLNTRVSKTWLRNTYNVGNTNIDHSAQNVSYDKIRLCRWRRGLRNNPEIAYQMELKIYHGKYRFIMICDSGRMNTALLMGISYILTCSKMHRIVWKKLNAHFIATCENICASAAVHRWLYS